MDKSRLSLPVGDLANNNNQGLNSGAASSGGVERYSAASTSSGSAGTADSSQSFTRLVVQLFESRK